MKTETIKLDQVLVHIAGIQGGGDMPIKNQHRWNVDIVDDGVDVAINFRTTKGQAERDAFFSLLTTGELPEVAPTVTHSATCADIAGYKVVEEVAAPEQPHVLDSMLAAVEAMRQAVIALQK